MITYLQYDKRSIMLDEPDDSHIIYAFHASSDRAAYFYALSAFPEIAWVLHRRTGEYVATHNTGIPASEEAPNG